MQNFEQLEEFFYMQKKSFWDLYAGTQKKSDRLLAKNMTEERLEVSFSTLRRAIELNRSNNDHFVIVLKDKVNQSAGSTYVNLDFEKPKEVQQAIVHNTDHSKILGLQESFNNTIIELKTELQEQKHQREIDKIVNDYELKLQEMKEQSGKNANMTQIGQTLITALLAPKPAVGHARIVDNKEETQGEIEELDYSVIDFNSVYTSIAILKKYIPDAEIMLHNLSVLIDEAESEMSRNQIITLLKTYTGG